LLTTTGIVPILDNVLATAVSAGVNNQFRDHALNVPYITST
jgi:hypothetical protein